MPAQLNFNQRGYRMTNKAKDQILNKSQTSDETQRMNTEQIKLLYANVPASMAATLVNSLILTFILWTNVSHTMLISWFACSFLITLFRYILVYKYKRASVESIKSEHWGTWLIVGIAAIGIVWGFGGVFLFPAKSIAHQIFLAFVFGGMIAGSVGSYSVKMEAFLAFSVPVSIPIIVQFLTEGSEIHIAMGGMMLLFVIIMLITAQKINASIITALKLQFENHNLIDILKIDKENTEKLNKKLETEISEHKNAEEELKKSGEKYRFIYETTGDAIMTLEPPEWRFTSGNNKIAEMFGVKDEEEFISLTPWQTSPEYQPDGQLSEVKAQKMIEIAMKKGEKFFEWIHKRVGGEEFFATVLLNRVEFGGKVFLQARVNDLTERKQAEEALRDSEEKFRMISDSAQEAIIMIDNDGNISYWNKAAEKIFGYTEKEAMEKNLHRFIVPESYYESSTKAFKIFQKSGQGDAIGKTIELAAVRKNGAEFPIEVSISPLKIKGKWNAMGILRDITERKIMQNELLKFIEEADSASKAKSEFLAGMSHEIRTPMNAIIGMAELISDTTLDEEQKEYLEIMKVSSNNLLGIINDILDISKIEAGGLELEQKEFNLPELVETTGASLAVRANKKRLELLCHIISDIPEYIISDPVRLRQILVNLIGNAIKFTEKGEIIISLRIEERKGNEALIHFWVSDTGVGIPKERQDRIFDSFTQADGSTTRKYGGTGLGLTISRQLAEKMGGRIWVESELGKGSVFNFTIRAAIVEKAKEKEKIIFPDLKHLKVLIIDDNLTNRLILQDTTSIWGLLPSEASGGQSGLKELESAKQKGDPYQLILLDKNMPDLDGFEVTQKIKQIPEYADVPIIFLTSSEEKGDRQKAKELGISNFLLKPVNRSKLYDAIINSLAAEGKKKEKSEEQKIESLLKDKSLKILLAEDNLINQKMAVRLLEKQGWQVTVANNGKEAVELIGKNGFDLVLMDVQMPEMDGIEATAEIRNMEKTSGKHISIIALTANAFEEDKRKCLESGMDAYTTKPIKIKELFGIIEDMFQRYSEDN
jgi:PAS domain S-box-containing protein